LHTYLRRRCHRDESDLAGLRFARKTDDSLGRKQKKSKKSKHHEKLENDKWGEEENGGEPVTAAENGYFDGFQIIDDDAELEEVEKLLEGADIIGDNDGECGYVDFSFDEKEIMALFHEAIGDERVRVLRELGDGTTVCVKKECDEMCCNCEMYNRWRICRHIVWMEVLHFAKYPPGDISDAEDGWEAIRDKILDNIKKTHIDPSE
jgi:hypothetical protein